MEERRGTRPKATRKQSSRLAKLAVVFVVAALLAAGGWLLVSHGPTKQNAIQTAASATSVQPSPTHMTQTTIPATTPTTTKPAGRQIGAIVYLNADGLPLGTLESLRGLHATEVYLYVAYWSDAYYAIPDNPYGLAEPRDSLGAAITELHSAGYRVIAVISSALLDWRQAPQKGLDILQSPRLPLFDPAKAGPFVEELTRSLVQYSVDGVCVGEPYWDTPTSDPSKQVKFTLLYQRLLAITQKAGVPFHMIMPAYYAYFDGTETASLDATFATLPFEPIGMDAEYSYYGADNASNLTYYRKLIDVSLSLAGSRDALIELSLHKAFASDPVPPDFFTEELSVAKTAGIKTVIIFAAEFWQSLTNQQTYSAALADFIAP